MTRVNKTIVNIIGWYGAGANLLGYFLISFDYIEPRSVLFQVLNFSGSIGIILISWAKRAYQPLLLNAVFASITLIVLLKIAFT